MSDRITSFDQLATQMGRRPSAPRGGMEPPPGPQEVGPLRVDFELAGDADASAINECRAAVLEWVQGIVDIRLPRKAWRTRPFVAEGKDATCRAARFRDQQRDHWALRLERVPAPGREIVTEIVIASAAGRPPTVGVAVHDRSVVPADLAAEYPARLIADINEQVPLFQGGRRVAHTPVVVESEAAMNVFLRTLMDPDRTLPAAVVTVAPEDDRKALESEWEVLARSLTGLAVTWALPPAMTFRLSDTVGKPLSVFLGAWRFYRPGFNAQAGQHQHPLVLRRRMEDERSVAKTTRRFVSMAADERMRAGQGEGAPELAPGAKGDREARPQGRDEIAYAEVAMESKDLGWRPKRLLLFLRDSIMRGRRSQAGRTVRPRASSLSEGAAPGPASAPDSVSAGASQSMSSPAPQSMSAPAPQMPQGAAAAPAPAPPATPPASAASAPVHVAEGTRAALAVPRSPVPSGPHAGPGAAQPPVADRRLRSKMRRWRERAERRQSQVERQRDRADKAESELEEARKRNEQLIELVRTLGGDPDVEIPFPTEWSEFAAWCEQRLDGRVVLAGPAVREVGGAQFRDVALAARCLLWLGGDYRTGRMQGGNPDLRGRIDSIGDGIFNVPCGGDSFDFTWGGRSRRVDWHIKSGANTRDPKRCLRIYYFWDDEKTQVVVVQMPAHRKTGMS